MLSGMIGALLASGLPSGEAHRLPPIPPVPPTTAAGPPDRRCRLPRYPHRR
nr:hypothetical protein [Mycobacterium tuberculosis]